jgi:uncharacterized delta-60 repeat protein
MPTAPAEGSVSRFNANGTLDTTWGGTGTVSGGAGAVAVQSDGKVVTAGAANSPVIEVTRYNADGSLDSTFGTGGVVTTSVTPLTNIIKNMAIQSNGDIVVGASSNSEFLVARYLPSAPQIGSFTASPNPVTAGSNVTLTASSITDGNPNSSITQVAFYVDSNSDGILEPDTDTLLGYGTQSGGTWTLTFSTADWAAAIDTLFAQAKDSDGVFGDPFALSLQVV